MIKTSKFFAIVTLAILACSNAAFADGSAFTPLSFDNANYKSTKPAQQTAKVQTQAPAQVQEISGNNNMQSAILELDNAQVDVRNELLNLKAKYSDIDAQYNLIKNERKVLGKQIKNTEKRIKQIEGAKERIRKNII